MTEAQIRIIKALAKDFTLFCKHVLKIINKNGQVVPFELNHEQQQLTKYVMECIAQGKPIRIIVLKSRKVGVSTWALALAYWLCTFNSDLSAVLAAHLQASAKEIGMIAKRFRKWQIDLLPKPKEIGPGLIWKSSSQLRVVTARSSDIIRGATPRFLLLTEAAFYDENRTSSSGEDFLSGALSAIPEGPMTFVIMESSPPRGKAGTFTERWNSAYKSLLAGQEAPYKAFFFSWKDNPILPDQYLAAIPEPIRRAHTKLMRGDISAAQVLKYPPEWIERVKEHQLTVEQTQWALSKTIGTYGGDISRFDKEYPLTPALAFTAGGKLVFSEKCIDSINANQKPYSFGTHLRESLTGVTQAWQIYETPVKGHEYVLGVDVSSGVELDYSTIQVFDRHTQQQVAEYRANDLPPGAFYEEVIHAARYYNDAFIVPERNADGGIVIQKLMDAGYTNVYNRGTEEHTLGYLTTPGTRPALISQLRERIRSGSIKLHSMRLANELSTFVYNQKGKADHMNGCTSDLIIALALAIEGDSKLGPSTPIKIENNVIDYEKANHLRQLEMRAHMMKRRR
jgi:hypothetical protein